MLICACGKADYPFESLHSNGTIKDAGPVVTDGCGWLIVLKDSVYYHPDNLPDNFKQDDLHVEVNYTNVVDTFHCGIANSKIPVINIVSIKQK